jgi:hypothetical protein
VRQLLLDRLEDGRQRRDERARAVTELHRAKPIHKVVRRARGQPHTLGARQTTNGHDVLTPGFYERLPNAQFLAQRASLGTEHMGFGDTSLVHRDGDMLGVERVLRLC